MSKGLKITLFIVIGIALIYGASTFLGKEEASSDNPLTSSGSAIAVNQDPLSTDGNSVADSESFRSVLAMVQNISLDTSLFPSPAYLSLKDNSVPLGDALVTRINPFATVGQDTGGVFLSQLSSEAFTIETVQPGSIKDVSAELSAIVSFTGQTHVDVGFQYSVSGGPIQSTPLQKVMSSGVVTVSIKNLEPGKTYTVQAFGIRGSNKQQGTSIPFTTKNK